MSVFKMFVQVIRARWKAITLYVLIFMAIFAAFSSYVKSQVNTDQEFHATSYAISIHDEDQSELSTALVAQLAKTNELVEVEHEEQAIKDALFYYIIDYEITIPKGFEQRFIAREEHLLETMEKPDRTTGYQITSMIEGYLSSVKAYQMILPDASIKTICSSVDHALSQESKVVMVGEQTADPQKSGLSQFFNYSSYIYLVIFVLSGGLVLMRVFDREISKRNHLAPMSSTKFHLQLFSYCIGGALLIWALFMVMVELMVGGLFTMTGVFYMLNSLIFIAVCMGIVYLLSVIIAGKSYTEEALSGFCTFAGLGMSFLGGVFVPQYLLSDGVQMIGSFLPTYWYVKANNALLSIHSFDFASMKEVYVAFGIQLMFALVFIVIALYISKMKQSAKEL